MIWSNLTSCNKQIVYYKCFIDEPDLKKITRLIASPCRMSVCVYFCEINVRFPQSCLSFSRWILSTCRPKIKFNKVNFMIIFAKTLDVRIELEHDVFSLAGRPERENCLICLIENDQWRPFCESRLWNLINHPSNPGSDKTMHLSLTDKCYRYHEQLSSCLLVSKNARERRVRNTRKDREYKCTTPFEK